PQRRSRCGSRGTSWSTTQSERAIRKLYCLSRQDSWVTHQSGVLQVTCTRGLVVMKNRSISKSAGLVLSLLVLVSTTNAQQAPSSPSPKKTADAPVEAGDSAGDYTIISSLEFGYRGLSV